MIAGTETPLGAEVLWAGRGTTALMALLRAAGPPGAGVLVPVNLCAIAVAGILWSGMHPVFHDVSAAHGNAESDHLSAVETSGCAVLLAVHNFGRPVDLPAFRAFANARGLMLVEDACNALGATRDGTPVGHTGDAAIYSFNSGKIVDCGHGGAVRIGDAALRAAVADALAAMPPYGSPHAEATARLEAELRAARQAGDVAAQRAALERYRPFVEHRAASDWLAEIRRAIAPLANIVTHRRRLAERYRRMITSPAVTHPGPVAGEVPWRYSILVPPLLRDRLLAHLHENGVPCSAWYPPVHGIFAPVAQASYPGAERFGAAVVNLWTDASTDIAAVDRASALIDRFLGDAPA